MAVAQLTDDLVQGVPVDPTLNNTKAGQQVTKQPVAAVPVPGVTDVLGAKPATALTAASAPPIGGTSTANDSLVASGLKPEMSQPSTGGVGLAGVGAAPFVPPSDPASPFATSPATGAGPASPAASYGAWTAPAGSNTWTDPNGNGLAGVGRAGLPSSSGNTYTAMPGGGWRGSDGNVYTDVGRRGQEDQDAMLSKPDATGADLGDISKWSEMQKAAFAASQGGQPAAAWSGDPRNPVDASRMAALRAQGAPLFEASQRFQTDQRNTQNATAQSGLDAAASAERAQHDAENKAIGSAGMAGTRTYANGVETTDPTVYKGDTALPAGINGRGLTPSGPTDVNGIIPANGGAAPDGADSTFQNLLAQYTNPGRQTQANNTDPASGVTSINPTNDLRSSVITDTPSARTAQYADMTDSAAGNLANVDRLKLATDNFNALSKAGDPAYENSLRTARRYRAANGGIGSGMLNTDYGNLALQRGRDLDVLKAQLSKEATEGGISDQFNKTNTLAGLEGASRGTDQTATSNLRGERSYENSQANDAFTKALAQYQTEQQAGDSAFDKNYRLLQLGESGNPSGAMGNAAGQISPAGDLASIRALTQAQGSAGGGSPGGKPASSSVTNNPQLDALLAQWMKQNSGGHGVQTTPGGGY